MQFQRKILSNGLRLLVVPMPSFESATVLVMVGAGSRYETKKNNGISHFLEHMAFKGTEKRPSAMDIAGLIDGIGGEFNAFTSKESTGYYIKAQATHVDLSLDLLSDMLQHSKLDQTEIDKEKGVILEEINLYEDTPMRKIGDIYELLLYGDTPMGWDIAGEKDIIHANTRQDFTSYMQNLYSADNMTVVIAGGVILDSVEPMVNKYFSTIPSFKTIPYPKAQEANAKPTVLLRKKETEQVHFAMGVYTVAYEHPDRYPLSVLSAILGGGMSSRLFEEIREKRGLSYYVRSHSDHYMDTGSFVSMSGVDPKRATEAVKVMREEYGSMASGVKPPTDNEITKAKEFLKGHLVLELEDSRAVAGYYAHQELIEKELLNPAAIMKKIDSVTRDQVANVASRYLTKPLNLAVIGNFDNSQEFENLIK